MEKGIRVEKVGKCAVLRMERGENRHNFEFIEAMNGALDEVERFVIVSPICKLSRLKLLLCYGYDPCAFSDSV